MLSRLFYATRKIYSANDTFIEDYWQARWIFLKMFKQEFHARRMLSSPEKIRVTTVFSLLFLRFLLLILSCRWNSRRFRLLTGPVIPEEAVSGCSHKDRTWPGSGLLFDARSWSEFPLGTRITRTGHYSSRLTTTRVLRPLLGPHFYEKFMLQIRHRDPFLLRALSYVRRQICTDSYQTAIKSVCCMVYHLRITSFYCCYWVVVGWLDFNLYLGNFFISRGLSNLHSVS